MKLLNKHKDTLIVSFLSISILGSLNINPNIFFVSKVSFQELFLNLNIINFFNFLRFFAPSFICLTILIYFLYNKKINLIKKIDIPSILLLLFFTTLYLRTYDQFFPETLYFLTYLNIFMFGLIISSYEKEFILKCFFITLIFYLFIVLILFILNLSSGFSNIFEIFDLRNVNILQFNYSFLNNATPRTTGLARILVFIFLIIYFFNTRSNSFFLKLLMFTLSFLIFSLSSRFSVGSLILAIIFFNIFYHKFNLKYLLKDIIFLLVLPYFFLATLHSIQVYYSKKITVEMTKELYLKEIDTSNNVIKKKKLKKKLKNEVQKMEEDNNLKEILNKNVFNNRITNITTPNSFINRIEEEKKITFSEDITTGRDYYWKFVINEYLKANNKLKYGNGILSDKKKLNTSISNSFFYSLYSNGLIGAILYILILLYFFINFLYFIIYHKIKNRFDYLIYNCIMILLLRGIVENSFLSQGMDLLIFIYLNQIIQKNSKSF
jgi:hypothetical protein